MQEIHRKLQVPIDSSQLAEVREFILQSILESESMASEANRIILAVDEAVSNVIEHAYANCNHGEVVISISISAEKVMVDIVDGGRDFDPTTAPDPDLDEHIKQGKQRGLGIFMIRQLMDEVTYEKDDDGRNRLTMIKYQSMNHEAKGVNHGRT